MFYSKVLEEKLNEKTAVWEGLSTRRMFGGLAYMIHGNVCLGIWQDKMIIRIGEMGREQIVTEPWYLPFDVTGKTMKGWAMVDQTGWADPTVFEETVAMAEDFVRNELEPKP